MNEIDLFVELIDDKAASQILREFNEAVPGFSKSPSLKQKKIHIRNFFRGQTMNMKRKKKDRINPFFLHLSAYKNQKNDELFGSYDAKGLLLFLANASEIPDYSKFAIALAYQPDTVREMLTQLFNNIQNKKPLFDIHTAFETQEEAEAYLQATSAYFKDHSVDHALEQINRLLDDRQHKRLAEVIAAVEPLSLVEFLNRQNEFKDDPLYLVNYAYAMTHPHEQLWIRTGLVFLITHQLMLQQKEKSKELEKISQTIEEYQQIHDTLKKENKEFSEKLKEEDKNRRLIDKERRLLEDEKLRLAEELQQLAQIFESSKRQHESEWEQARLQQATAKQKMEGFIEECRGEGSYIEFAVVYTGEFHMFHTIYPEITAINFKEWSQYKSKLQDYSKLYIQRDGLDSRLIKTLQTFCRKHNIQPVFFLARNEKEMIELIGHYKRQLMEV
ncbi:hypothetical protein [Paenibacillus sp. GXUN7292]|uniref:hypothetical protein n=1 Tax=Paenibacillus sp. GXUN7292 TaxID=3422499 RepID=UPI003D7C61F0